MLLEILSYIFNFENFLIRIQNQNILPCRQLIVKLLTWWHDLIINH